MTEDPDAFTHLDQRDNEDGTFTLLKPLHFTGDRAMIRVPAGFRHDYASVPRIFQNIVSPYGKHSRASVVHDYLYLTGGMEGEYTRGESDRIFLEAMRASGVPAIRRGVMYSAVRAWGWMFWKRKKPKTAGEIKL